MASNTQEITTGAAAPTFTASSTQSEVNLSLYLGKQHVVLYFMRALSCALCQRHVTQLKEMYSELQAKHTTVVVVGAGTQQEAEELANKLQLPFPLIAESTGDLYIRYNLGKSLVFIQRSGTFLINRHGIITYIHTATNPSASMNKGELQAAIQLVEEKNSQAEA